MGCLMRGHHIYAHMRSFLVIEPYGLLYSILYFLDRMETHAFE